MKRLLAMVLLALPLSAWASEYQSTLLVQTGQMREGDLIIRTVSDLESNKICLAFYIATAGTSPSMTCYGVKSGFRSAIKQVGHFKEGELVVRKIKDAINHVSCLVAYVSTPGTSPSIDCYQNRESTRDQMNRSGHLREGDLDVYRIKDIDSAKTCLVAYVRTTNTAPNLACYDSRSKGKMALEQTQHLREGDLVVRKIVDHSNREECLVAYVSTEGTSPYIYCSEAAMGATAAMPTYKPRTAAPAKPVYKP